MPYILAALGAFAAIAFFVLRAHRTAQAAKDLLEVADDTRKLVRRSAWKHRSRAGANEVDDPREAAAAMMTALAQCDGSISEREEAVIQGLIESRFEIDAVEATELFSRGRWLARDIGDPASFCRRFFPLLRTRCTPAERNELVEMLRLVAHAEGSIDPLAERSFRLIQRELGAS